MFKNLKSASMEEFLMTERVQMMNKIEELDNISHSAKHLGGESIIITSGTQTGKMYLFSTKLNLMRHVRSFCKENDLTLISARLVGEDASEYTKILFTRLPEIS